MSHRAPDPSHDARQRLRRPARQTHDASHWAFGTDFEDPLAGVDTTVPDGVDAARAGDVLPDARRRRAGRSPTGSRSGAAARPTSRTTSRWPTSPSTCSARPGCCSPGRPRPTRGSCPRCRRARRCRAEDALAFFRERRRLPQRPAGRGRQRRLRPHVARLLLFSLRAARGLRAAGGAAPTRCSPRSPPRASRSSPTTATTPAAGSSPWRRAPRSRGAGSSPASPTCGRCTPSCSAPTRSRPRSPRPGSASTRRTSPTRSTWCSTRCSRSAASTGPSGRHASVPPAAPAATGCTPRR